MRVEEPLINYQVIKGNNNNQDFNICEIEKLKIQVELLREIIRTKDELLIQKDVIINLLIKKR